MLLAAEAAVDRAECSLHDDNVEGQRRLDSGRVDSGERMRMDNTAVAEDADSTQAALAGKLHGK